MALPKPRYYGHLPRQAKGAVFGIEKLGDMLSQIIPLYEKHYVETETKYLKVPMNPRYDTWIELEALAQFVLFTVRVDGELVGYLQYYVYLDTHSRSNRVAREDAYFLREDHRGSGLAAELLAYAEDILVKLGCEYVGMSSKGPIGGPDLDGFLKRRGYRHVANFYMKPLAEDDKDVLQRPTPAS